MTMQLPFVDEIVDQLEDVGFVVDVMYPYVIVSLTSRNLDPMEVALALDIEPEFCVRNLEGNIRIHCD